MTDDQITSLLADNGDWTSDDERYDNAYRTIDFNDCTDGTVIGYSLPLDGSTDGTVFPAEHILELQTPKLFFNDIAKNGVPVWRQTTSGWKRVPVPSGFDQIYSDFFDFMKAKVLSNPPALRGYTEDSIVKVPMERIMHALGDIYNWEHFVLVEENINAFKSRIWAGHMPIALDRLIALNADVNRYQEQLITMRTLLNVFNYLNVQKVHDNLIATCNDVREELRLADEAWTHANNPSTHIVEYWDKWLRAHFQAMIDEGRWFIRKSLTDCFNLWKAQPNSNRKIFMLRSLATLRRQMNKITINVDGLDEEQEEGGSPMDTGD